MGADRTGEERAILEQWPVVTGEDIERLNDLFPHYIFFRRHRATGRGGVERMELHTSCCGRREVLEELRREVSPEERVLWWDCVHGRARQCPWCGRAVTMKDLGRAGKRKGLRAWAVALVLHGQGEALYADAVALQKRYETEGELTGRPKYRIASGYRFTLGDVMQVDYEVWSGGEITHERERLGRRKLVGEPFTRGSCGLGGRESYYIVNREELEGHPVFRYCGYFDRWGYGNRRGQRRFFDLVSYLTAYCIYPRQVEMFVKAGYPEPVEDLVYRRKKNVGAIDWTEPDARKALGLDRRELHHFLAVRPRLVAVEVKKYVARHWGKGWPLAFCIDFTNLWGVGLESMTVLSFLKWFGLDPDRFLRYLGGLEEDGVEGMGYADLFEAYRDYLEASYVLGRCMEHGAVLWPRQLLAAHDEATAALAAARPNREGKGLAAGAGERKRKYEFELDGLKIVFPMTARAIRQEGQALAHCVGGYAERHMKGILTILFLRRVDDLRTPYVTIEMEGNRMKQIHGYRNDRGKVSPRTEHQGFLDTWLAWLKKGSPRNEDGSPRLAKQRKRKEGAA